MKTIHYYANELFQSYEDEQPDRYKANALLTQNMVRCVIARMASGPPPYIMTVPGECLCHAHEWGIPTSLLTIIPKPNRIDDHPFDTVQIQFRDSLAVIHSLRFV